MKKDYIKPEIQEIKLETVDVITVSGWVGGEDETPLVPVFH